MTPRAWLALVVLAGFFGGLAGWSLRTIINH